jgi:hypothetical protein
MIKATKNAESIINRAQALGFLAGFNLKPGSNHRALTTNGDSKAVPNYPFVIDGKRMSWNIAKQFLQSKESKLIAIG